jgi:tetratricopeptide (TPR) repeat protein
MHLAMLALLGLGVSSCVTAQGEIQTGRRELLYGDPNVALVHFQTAATERPDTVHFSMLPQSAWTYVGRAYYETGRLPEARQALERGVARSSDDSLARLYLGLTLAREGDRPGGLKNIESGLIGINDWLDWLERSQPFTLGIYWDPRKEIRGEIRTQLAMIGPSMNWPQLIAGGEWVGRQMEEEIDRARFDERQEWRLEGEGKQP